MKNLFALVGLVGITFAPWAQAETTQTRVILSPVYSIDKKYKSMEGPQSTQAVALSSSTTPELLWITAFKTEMVQADGVTPTLPEFMCHVNLDYNTSRHAELFKNITPSNARLLTLSQGQIEARLPEGFGIPVISNEPISMTTQVLNFNLDNPNLQVRHKVTFEYVRDQDLSKPMKPVFNTSGFGMALLEGDHGRYGISGNDTEHHGESCLPGTQAPNAVGGSVYTDQFRQKFTGHWVVKPGREVKPTNITRYMALPYDTTLHYAAIHLHPFAESLELRDITAKKRIFKSKARSFKDKIGLVSVSSFSSKKGIPLYKDHEYELISTYNNTTPIDQDSMAVMMLFMLDKRFQKPAISTISSPPTLAPLPSTGLPHPRLVLKTTLGKMVFELYPEDAPQTVNQIINLVSAGAYDGTPFYRLEKGFVLQTANIQGRATPLTPEQTALLHPLPAEFSATLKHARGVLSMARMDNDINSGESSFSILLVNAPHLDAKYTIFGRLETGEDVLKRLEASPTSPTHQPVTRLEIQKAEIKTPKTPPKK